MTISRAIGLGLLALATLLPVGCGGAKEQSPEQFKSGLEEAAKAAERGKALQQGKEKGVPPVEDPAGEG